MPQGNSFWFDMRVYLAVMVGLLLVIAWYNWYLALGGLALLYALYRYGRARLNRLEKHWTEYVQFMGRRVDQAGYYALEHLPQAIAIVDKEGNVQWHNRILYEWLHDSHQGEHFFEAWEGLNQEEVWGKEGQVTAAHTHRHYNIVYRPLQDEGKSERDLMLFYISDITALERVKNTCIDAMPVFAFVQIDNYDDVLKDLTEAQRSAILSEVNRQIVTTVEGLNGFVRQFRNDSYIVIITRSSLQQILEKKVEILDSVREIKGGNKIPVTLSIGMASGMDSIFELAESARSGLDLALGRGGDQAAVNVDGKMQFYGGKAKAVEKNTRVKARVFSQAVRELIKESQQVFIMGHADEDYDALGAAMGVAKMVRHDEKPVHIIVSHPGTSVNKLEELLPHYEEFQDLFLSPDAVMKMSPENYLLFVVDTHRPELTAAPALLERSDKVVLIDHHRRSESFISNPILVYLEPSASSTSEIVTELLQYYDEDIDLNRLEASTLYAGIVLDTKNFAVQTGVRTFEAASYLRRAGADPSMVRQLFRTDFESIRIRSKLLANTAMMPGGFIITCCEDMIKNVHIIAAQAADMMLTIEGVRASVVIYPMEEGSVGISARSQGDVNVQVLMEKVGGGGHQTVAGAQLKDTDCETVRQQIEEIFEEYRRESESDESDIGTGSKKTW